MGALGSQHCPVGPGTTESKEWVNGGLRQILPGTQPGVSGAGSSQPCQGELREGGAGTFGLPLPSAGCKHRRAELWSRRDRSFTKSNSPRPVAPRLRSSFPLPFRSHLREPSGTGLCTNSSWGGDPGSCSCSAEGGGGNQNCPVLKPRALWPGASCVPPPRPQFTPPALPETQ